MASQPCCAFDTTNDALDPVTNLAVAVTADGGEATWTAPADATSYTVWVTDANGNVVWGPEVTTDTSATITGLDASTEYTAHVVAHGGSGFDDSPEATATFTTTA